MPQLSRYIKPEEEEVKTLTLSPEISESANTNVSNLVALYLPDNIEEEIGAKIRNPWHTVDYRLRSETVDYTEAELTSMSNQMFSQLIAPSMPGFANVQNIVAFNALFSRAPIQIGAREYDAEISKDDKEIPLSFLRLNRAFSTSALEYGARPSTPLQSQELSVFRSHMSPVFLIPAIYALRRAAGKSARVDELDKVIYRNSKLDTNAPVRRFYTPILIGTKKPDFIHIEEYVKAIDVSVRPYNHLGITQVDIDDTNRRQIHGRTFCLAKAKIASTNGTVSYMVDDGDLDLVEALKSQYKIGSFVFCNRGVKRIPPGEREARRVEDGDFICIIEDISYDNKNMPQISFYVDKDIMDGVSIVDGVIDGGNGPADILKIDDKKLGKEFFDITVIAPADIVVYSYGYGFIDAYGLYERFRMSGPGGIIARPFHVDKILPVQKPTHDFSPEKYIDARRLSTEYWNATVASESSLYGATGGGYGNDGRRFSFTGITTRIMGNGEKNKSIALGSLAHLLAGYEVMPVDVEKILSDGSSSTKDNFADDDYISGFTKKINTGNIENSEITTVYGLSIEVKVY